tara:strand:- start:448 stop:879 length:432 start_codon:yes stop_codon:yes gene_type:complete
MSVISEIELDKQIKLFTTSRNFEAGLFFANGLSLTASTPYSTFVLKEVSATQGGYARLSYTYTDSDIQILAGKAVTAQKYLQWVHNGNANLMRFDTLVVFERFAAQPLDIVNPVSIHPLGATQELASGGNILRISLQVNLKTQ